MAIKHRHKTPRCTRKIASFFVIMTLFFASATAQNEGQYSHFMFNQLSYNPAYAGASGALSFSALYNNQWMGLDLQAPTPELEAGVTPSNYLASFDMPVNFLHGGIGLLFNSESIGYHKNTTINIDYAFRIYWGRGNLAAGIEANLYNFGFNTENLRGPDDLPGMPGQGAGSSSDPSVNGQEVSEFKFDVSTGLYYQVPGEYYLSISVKNLLASKFEQIGFTNARTVYAMDMPSPTIPHSNSSPHCLQRPPTSPSSRQKRHCCLTTKAPSGAEWVIGGTMHSPSLQVSTGTFPTSIGFDSAWHTTSPHRSSAPSRQDAASDPSRYSSMAHSESSRPNVLPPLLVRPVSCYNNRIIVKKETF